MIGLDEKPSMNFKVNAGSQTRSKVSPPNTIGTGVSNWNTSSMEGDLQPTGKKPALVTPCTEGRDIHPLGTS